MKKPQKIPAEAIAIFKRMQTHAEEGDREAWWAEHNRLHDLLKLKPWQFPAIQGPDVVHDPNNASLAPDPEAQRRYRDFTRAAAA